MIIGARSAAAPIALAASANVLTAWDLTAIALGMPTIAADLGGGQWLVPVMQNAYPLALAAAAPLATGAAVRWGAERFFAAGTVGLVLGAALCALAFDPALFIAGRLVLGAASAMVLDAALALLARARGEGALSRALAITTAFTAAGLALGPLVSGALIDLLGWRALFGIQGAAAFALMLCSLPLSLRPDAEQGGPASRRATGTALMLSAAIIALTVGVQAVASFPGIAAIAIAVALALGLVALHRERRSPRPLLPQRLRRSRVFMTTLALGALLYASVSASQPFQSLLLQADGWTATASGVFLLTVTGGIAVGSAVSAALARRMGIRNTVILGLVLAAIGAGLLVGIGLTPMGILLAAAGNVLSGFGVGIASPQSLAIGMAQADEQATTSAAGVQTTMRRAASAIGYAGLSILLVTGSSLGSATALMFAAALVLTLAALVAAVFGLSRDGGGTRTSAPGLSPGQHSG